MSQCYVDSKAKIPDQDWMDPKSLRSPRRDWDLLGGIER